MDYLQKLDLNGRRALVTGGAGGIGAACVDALLEAGATVTIVDFDEVAIESALARLKGQAVAFERLDITDREAVAALAERLEPMDILVNNAGVGRQAAAEDITSAEWDEVMNLNLDAVFWCSQAFGAKMLAAGKGSIVNIGSMAGDIVVRPQNNVHYNASKAGVHHITKSLAAEWGSRGVRVNAVAPGFIETPMNSFALKNDVDTTTIWLDNTPTGRVGQPHEIASIVQFLASDAASLMTGSIVAADGGYTVW